MKRFSQPNTVFFYWRSTHENALATKNERHERMMKNHSEKKKTCVVDLTHNALTGSQGCRDSFLPVRTQSTQTQTYSISPIYDCSPISGTNHSNPK